MECKALLPAPPKQTERSDEELLHTEALPLEAEQPCLLRAASAGLGARPLSWAGQGVPPWAALPPPVGHPLGKGSHRRWANAGLTLAVLAGLTLLGVHVSRGASSRVLSRGQEDATEARFLFHSTVLSLYSRVCPATDPVVAELRKQSWPRRNAGPPPLITQVKYINLEWDKSRRQYMEDQMRHLRDVWRKELRGHPLLWQRIPGTAAHEMQQSAGFRAWREKGFSRAPHPHVDGDWAIAACAHSHYKAIQSIPMAGEELVLIAEDDVELKQDFPQLWQQLWPWLPEDWDVLRLGWFGDHQNCSQVVNSRIDLAAWQQPPGGDCMYCGAQAYIVNPRSKMKVLSRFEISGMTHADELLGAPTPLMEDAAEVPPLRSFVVWPMLASTHFNEVGYPAFPSDRLAHGPTTTASPSAQTPWWTKAQTTASTTIATTQEQPNLTIGGLDREEERKRMQEEKEKKGYVDVMGSQDKDKGTEERPRRRGDEATDQRPETGAVARRSAEDEVRALKKELKEVQAQEAEEEEARKELEQRAAQAEAARQHLREAFEKERAAREAAEDKLSDMRKKYWITPKFPTAPPLPKIDLKPLPVPHPHVHPLQMRPLVPRAKPKPRSPT